MWLVKIVWMRGRREQVRQVAFKQTDNSYAQEQRSRVRWDDAARQAMAIYVMRASNWRRGPGVK
jgi:hypothetical protein